MKRPPLTIETILGWADAHVHKTGAWPTTTSGRVHGARAENWRDIDAALRYGRRGLPGGASLGLLLAEYRGAPAPTNRRPLTVAQILTWADSYRRRTGSWPTEDSGLIPEAPEENWRKINAALRLGARSLPSGRSLGRLLAEERGARNRTNLPLLTLEQVLAWADSYRRRTGRWPGRTAGPIPEAPGESWGAITLALRNGYRGLPRGTSLRQVLAARNPWQEEVARRYQAGESLKQLAQSFGVSPESVRQALIRRKVPRRPPR